MKDKKFYLISIDVGASKKIDELAQFLSSMGWSNFEVIQCNKKRNVKTGKIDKFEVFAENLNNSVCIISDDICDGGASFIFAAKELLKKNAGELYLFTSHGIFSKGFDELQKYYGGIYTTNSFRDLDFTNVTQYQIMY